VCRETHAGASLLLRWLYGTARCSGQITGTLAEWRTFQTLITLRTGATHEINPIINLGGSLAAQRRSVRPNDQFVRYELIRHLAIQFSSGQHSEQGDRLQSVRTRGSLPSLHETSG